MRIKIRYKLKVIFGFFWSCTFPWAYMVTFKILLYMWLLLSVLVLKCLASKKGKKERRRKKKRFSSNPLEVTSGKGVATIVCGTWNSGPCLCFCTSVITSSHQQFEHRSPILKHRLFIAHLGFCKLCIHFSRTHLLLPAIVLGVRGSGMDSLYHDKSWN